MIAVLIQLWPYGDEKRAHEIGRMYIANDGTTSVADPRFGDYRVAVCKRGTTEVPRDVYDLSDPDQAAYAKDRKAPKSTRAARVRGYPRLAYNVWRLIARAVTGAFPEELNTRKGRGETVLDAEVMKGLQRIATYAENTGLCSTTPEGAEQIAAARKWLDAALESKDLDAARAACGLDK